MDIMIMIVVLAIYSSMISFHWSPAIACAKWHLKSVNLIAKRFLAAIKNSYLKIIDSWYRHQLGYNNNFFNAKSSGVYTSSKFCGNSCLTTRLYCDTVSKLDRSSMKIWSFCWLLQSRLGRIWRWVWQYL